MDEKSFAKQALAQKADEWVDTLLALDKDQRRALAPLAYGLWKEVDAGRQLNRWQGLLPGASATRQTTLGGWGWTQQRGKLGLAVLALCPVDKAKRLRWLRLPDIDELLRKVIATRDPAWRDAWLRHQLQEEFPGYHWAFVRGLVRDGLCARPEAEGYVRLMVEGLNPPFLPRPGTVYSPLTPKLLEDAGLLEDEIWRLFKTDTRAFEDSWVRKHPKCPPDYESWSDALVKLAETGQIDRQRLLDESLAGLWRSLNNAVLAGYHTLHTRLAPNDEELQAREQPYRELLGHRSGPVVGFALRQLGQLVHRKALHAEETLKAMPPLFNLSVKAHPLAALKLMGRIIEQDTSALNHAFPGLMEALRHPASDVQQAAAGLLSRYADVWTPAQQSQWQGLLGELSPLARGKLADASPDLSGGQTDTEQSPGVAPPPLPYAITDVAVLADIPAFMPIANVDELIDAVAHAVEQIDSAEEVERIIDGIARLFADRPANFALRTQPVLKRLKTGGRSDARGLALWDTPQGLRDLVLAWLTSKPHYSPYPIYARPHGPVRFFDLRLRELARHLLSHGPIQPLATPTHAHGWIDPRRLIARLEAYAQGHRQAIPSDLLQALLRLAPDGRAEALQRIGDFKQAWAAPLRWALGDDATLSQISRKYAALWVAAGRAGYPQGDLRGPLAALKLSITWPDVLQAARYHWQASLHRHTRYRQEIQIPSIGLQVSTALPEIPEPPGLAWGFKAKLRKLAYVLGRPFRWLGFASAVFALSTFEPRLALPTCLPHESLKRHWTFGFSSPWLAEWTQTLWPLNGEAWLAQAANQMAERIDMAGSTELPLTAYLNPLFEPGRPWSELGVLILWLGLASRQGDLKGLAVDLLIEGIADGRAHPQALADVLTRLNEGGWLKAHRVAEALREVARVSPLHQWTAACIMEAALEVFLGQTGKANVALELLLEWFTETNAAPLPQTIERLSTFNSGKAGAAAKAIRALAGRTPLADSPQRLTEAWEVRRGRLLRWGVEYNTVELSHPPV